MKKITALLLIAAMVFSFTACSENNSGAGAEEPKTGISGTNDSAASQESTDSQATQDAASPEDNGEGTENVKILVAYFSATNTTKGVAEAIAGVLGADLYEITPENPYTAEDLNYHDDNSRSTIEMNDPDSRPAISGSVENMEQYDIVFIGYPIWWAQAPRIICTFVESYDFSGKTIVPFCTSGGSGVGSSSKNLEGLADQAAWLSGTLLKGGASRDSLAEWIDGLGLNISER